MSDLKINEEIEIYRRARAVLVEELEDFIKPLQDEITHYDVLIRRLQDKCKHKWSKWYGEGYDRERKCTICGWLQ